MNKLRKWYYKRLFVKIYFVYLNRLNNLNYAINAAYNDIKAI